MDKIKKQFLDLITLADLNTFAKKNNVILPKDYRQFLLKYNGGILKNQRFYSLTKNDEYSCEVLFGIDDNKTNLKHITLNDNWLSLTKSLEMPSEIFPIGEDAGGNQLCICLEGENYGKIYFYDHEWWNEDDKGNITWENLYLIANSFTDFLEKLH